MAEGADHTLFDGKQVVLLRCWRECEHKESAIGTELGVLDAADVVSENEVARGYAEHGLGLLVDHVSVCGDFLEAFVCLVVGVVDRSVVRVMQTCKDLHEGVG